MNDPGYGTNRKTTPMKPKVSYLKITIKFKNIWTKQENRMQNLPISRMKKCYPTESTCVIMT